MLNYSERFGERGRIVQSVMVKADLWLLEEEEVGMELVASSGRPAVHQNETSS